MVLIAGVVFAVAAISELAGVALVVHGIRAAKKHLDAPITRILDGGNEGKHYNLPPRENSDPSARFLLEAMEKQKWAVVLLVIGIVAGTIGNFPTLG